MPTPSTVIPKFGIWSASPPTTESGLSSSSSLPTSLLSVNNDSFGEVPLSNRCFCNYGPSVCDMEDTCIKHTSAACFHAIVLEFNSGTGAIERRHFFGCAPLEKGSDASHLTCNAWRSSHSNGRSVACCYEGNFCNRNLTLPDSPALEFTPRHRPSPAFPVPSFAPFAFLLFGFLVGLCLLLTFAVPFRCWLLKKKGIPSGVVGTSSSTDSAIALLKQFQQKRHSPAPLQRQAPLGFEQSCSASVDGVTLVQRSIALDLQLMEVFARGRYGELRKAFYRGTVVAVKIFYTTEEESWQNERDIYQCQMLNHENILQFVAADILSSVESLTQMLLITDFHPLGSLYDFLRANGRLSLDEALQFALSTISGLEHLHNALRGTAGRRKPEIAHRDIKSKNVLVKRRGVCCVADFGLAVRFEDGQIVPRNVNISVGTKRYMAPELLLGTLNVRNFDAFKSADIYSFALVLWEILHCVQVSAASSECPPSFSSVPPPASSLSLPFSAPYACAGVRPQRMLGGRSSGGSSGFASSGCSADRNFAAFSNSLPMGGQSEQQHFGELEVKTAEKTSRDGEEGKRRTGDRQQKVQREHRENREQREYREHALPFKGMVGNDPSFEQMRQIVCVQKLRPPMETQWNDGANPIMHSLYVLMTECWSEHSLSRHTALKVKKELGALSEQRGDGRGKETN
ncbi:hypothetical protein niasHS_003505 [Heterodera schachtii]|uniref:Serine/threonine-protein kinase receptor n=1 Tax=Heterodera schachtii TaxID=97005 RepID=A0ABD2KGQ3_HETSC